MTILPLTLTLRATGDAAVGEVWDRYRRLDRWTEWAPQIREVRADTKILAEGIRGDVVGPLGATVHFLVLAVDEHRREWEWRVWRGPVRVTLHHTVSQLPTGSATSLRIRAFAPVVLGYAPIAQWALNRLTKA